MTQQTKNELFSVRIDPKTKAEVAEILTGYGLSLSDAVRILFTRIVAEKGLPQGLVMNESDYDKWFRAKVQEALDATGPTLSHETVMTDVEAAISQVALQRNQGA